MNHAGVKILGHHYIGLRKWVLVCIILVSLLTLAHILSNYLRLLEKTVQNIQVTQSDQEAWIRPSYRNDSPGPVDDLNSILDELPLNYLEEVDIPAEFQTSKRTEKVQIPADKELKNGKRKPVQRNPIPKLVHLTWFTRHSLPFRFHHAISLLSIHKFIKPSKIIFWHDQEPLGYWWNYIRQKVPNIILVYRKAPTSIFGNPLKVPEHQSDVVRIESLMEYGGIYLDLDVVVVSSLDPLLKYGTVMGAESPKDLGSGVILSEPNSTFLKLWYNQYASFNDRLWNYHSVVVSMRLAKLHPDLLHIEWHRMHRPNWMETAWLYTPGKLWDWFDNYTVHLWYRFYNIEHTPDSIRNLNTTMGEVFRYIFYGSPDLIPSKSNGR